MAEELTVNTEDLEDCVQKLKETVTGLNYIEDYLEKVKFPSDSEKYETFSRNLKVISIYTQDRIDEINQFKTSIEKIIEDFINAEKNVPPPGGGSGGGNVITPTNTEIISDEPEKSEISDTKQDIKPEESEIATQVEAIISILYGEDVELSDEEKQAIIEAVKAINDTKFLDGLSEERANAIRAKVIKDALDGKIELTGITAEELQAYIESQPSINIELEIDKAIKNFDSLIEEGIFTEEEINAIIEKNIKFYDSEEAFIEAYIEAGGTQTDISQVESFYDPETQTVHIRDTADSVVITNSIITILGEELFIDEETGEVSYYNPDQVEIGESDTVIEMPDDTIDNPGNMTDVEIGESNTTIDMSEDTVDSSGNMTDVELDENNTTVNISEDTVDSSGNMTDVELDENNTTVNISEDTVDSSGNMTDVKLEEDETNINIPNEEVISDEQAQVEMSGKETETTADRLEKK